jgi:CTP synthase (UTP-ammonia lyase)
LSNETVNVFGGLAEVLERHRHRYEVNPDKVDQLEEAGLKFVGKVRSFRSFVRSFVALRGVLIINPFRLS